MKLKRIIQVLFNRICPNIYNSIVFRLKNGYWCNLNSPTTFNEKIQWRKKNQHDSRFPLLVDKFEVRDWIKERFPDIVVPTYGVYECSKDINYNVLPDKFIMKPTHGFGKVIICTNKNELNIEETTNTVNEWLGYNQFYITGEWQYKDLKPRIIIDKLLGENICDYKFFCFDGEPYAIQIDFDRYIGHKRQIRDINWNLLDCKLAYPIDSTQIKKPEVLDKMLEISRVLSKDFDFVRVDLFLVEGNIYFSELTFTPGNGMDRFLPRKYDYIFGDKWIINKGM